MLIILLHFSVVELFSPLPPLASSSLVLVRLTVANPPSSPYWKQTKEGGESRNISIQPTEEGMGGISFGYSGFV